MTVAEMWPSRRLGDGLRDLKSSFSPIWESQAWVGARKPPLAVASVVGADDLVITGGGAGATLLLRPLLLFLAGRLAPANSMSSRLSVFSLTFPSAVVAVPDGAEVRRTVVSFSLLLDTEEPPADSVEDLRRSLAMPLLTAATDLALTGLV